MSFKLPYLSLYLRQVVTGRVPSGKPWTKAIRNKVTIQDLVRQRLALPQGQSLRRMEERRPALCPTPRRWLHAAPERPSPLPAEKGKSGPTGPKGDEMSEAEILEREVDPTDKDSRPQGADLLQPDSVPEPRDRAKELMEHPEGPYIQTKEGLVHISKYYP